MAFDQTTRNRLSRFVSDARALLTGELTRQLQHEYGMDPDRGDVADLARLAHLDDARRETARLLRDTLEHYLAGAPDRSVKTRQEVLERIVREQAFTVLDRLCALRMAEARGLLLESTARGYRSKGFQLYLRLAGTALGETGDAYRGYLFSVFDELAVDLPVLFDRFSPHGRLFPREAALLELLALMDDPEIGPLWGEDETIGWIYQYFNSKEERKKMRDASAAPRNSRELAVRNQFFTPRYVVEFLTDNTLGRIWYEMTRGETGLKDSCRYLVRRPVEIFLEASPAEDPSRLSDPTPNVLSDTSLIASDLTSAPLSDPTPNVLSDPTPNVLSDPTPNPLPVAGRGLMREASGSASAGREAVGGKEAEAGGAFGGTADARDGSEADDGSSREALLKQPVYIPYRALKDPRDLRLLDPACGSMHFGLYAFDLFEQIYEEAWELEQQGAVFVREGGDAASKTAAPNAGGQGRGASGTDTGSGTGTVTGTDSEGPSRGGVRAALSEVYASKEEFMRDVPRLILEHNIHGIDIDPRAAQIAGLSLWLRAQKSWQAQGVKAAGRPAIGKSNIVCAEPMPGEEAFLREFLEAQLSSTPEQRLLGQLVTRVFGAMKLAGEAGSLLKIEEEIAGDVAEAKRKWGASRTGQVALFERRSGPADPLELDVSGITDAAFWEGAEERIYAALRAYAEQAENGHGYQRRLFAGDAARGFAFIDICRKRYDVVVMNPPFGEPVGGSQSFIASYPKGTPTNLYSLFMVRAATMLWQNGAFGIISDSTYLKQPTYLQTRQLLLSKVAPLNAIVDLGWNVLDANVRTAMSVVVRPGIAQFVALDVSDKDEHSSCLLDAVSSNSFILKHHSDVLSLPKSVFALELSTNAGRTLTKLESLGQLASLPWGCGANDSFRLFRLRWEIDYASNLSSWVFMTNGGSFSPFYRENFLVCRAKVENGESAFDMEFRNGTDTFYDAAGRELYFLPGLTYPKRSEFFHVSLLPSGHIFTPEGKGFFPHERSKTWFYLGLLNSAFTSTMAKIVCGPHKQRGDVELIKIPLVDAESVRLIAMEAEELFSVGRNLMQGQEYSVWFLFPTAPSPALSISSRLRDLANNVTEMTMQSRERARKALGIIDSLVRSAVPSDLAHFCEDSELMGQRDKMWSEIHFELGGLLSYLLGCALARWDIRYATGEKQPPELPDPFAPLPVCPPGMLQNDRGLPLTPEDVRALEAAGQWHYPLHLPWDGILVDDPGHPRDLEARVRAVLEVVWQDRADAIEREACELLGVRTLRDYFRKSIYFFADHLKRYSKSRRQAPLYWPLSTPSGSYTIWLYYHRLTDQTLYTAVNDYLEPKLKQTLEEAQRLRLRAGRSRLEEAELGRLSDLALELQDFRGELLRIAGFWKPDLNDGVQITAAPLWRLFQLRPWQKKLKETWEALERGEYDWAHLAYAIWPARVREKCRTDRSLAIAHDLEALYVAPPAAAGRKRGRKQADVEQEALFDEG